MEPIYFNPGVIKYKINPDRLYCEGKDHKGIKCEFRATHEDTQMCGFHHLSTADEVVVPLRPFKINGNVASSFPQKKHAYELRPRWLLPFPQNKFK